MITRREYLKRSLALGAALGRLPDTATQRRMIEFIEALPA